MGRLHFQVAVLMLGMGVAASLLSTGAAAASFAFYAPGYRVFTPRATSTDGSVVVGECNGTYAFRWTAATGFTRLGTVNFTRSAYGVTADGSVSVGEYGYGEPQAAKWQGAEAGVQTLGVLTEIHSTSDTSCARGCSLDGSVIVGQCYSAPLTPVGFRWTAAGTTFLGTNSVAYACSGDGGIIAGQSGNRAAVWDATGGWTMLGSTAVGSAAVAMSTNGQVVAGYNPYTLDWYNAFVWTSQGGLVNLGRLPGTDSCKPVGVSGDGSVVVGTWRLVFSSGGFIWSQSKGMRDIRDALAADYGIDLTGWRINSVDAISRDGRTILGVGYSPSGTYGMWVATVPEPSSVVTLATALCLLRSVRRRRRR